MTRTILIVVGIVAIAAANAKATVPVNLIVNGDFESPTVIGLDNEFTAPSNGIAGWAVTSGSVDLNTSGSTVLGDANTGAQMIDINGSSAGTIEQTFPTTAGANYLLQLYYSNNPNPSFAEPSYSASVSIIGTNTIFQQTLVHAGATEANMNWLPFSKPFVANSATTILRLQSLQSGFNGVYFDTISVLPEPSSAVPCILAAFYAVSALRKKAPSAH